MLSQVYEMESEETPSDVEGCLLLLICDASHESEIVKDFVLDRVLTLKSFSDFVFASVTEEHACVAKIALDSYPALLRFESGTLRDKACGMDESLDLYAEFVEDLR